MGHPTGRGKAVLAAQSQDQVHRAVEIAFVSHRDKDRLDRISCSDDGSNDLATIDQWTAVTALRSGCTEFTAQSCFGTTDCRNVQPEAQMACDAESPRMGQPMP